MQSDDFVIMRRLFYVAFVLICIGAALFVNLLTGTFGTIEVPLP